ncbi:MAG: acetyltransferase [Planctomycetota bacterium]
MARSLVIIGGGGHGEVVAEAAKLLDVDIAGVLDDVQSPPACEAFGLPHLGGLSDFDLIGEHSWILALGDLKTRRDLLDAGLEMVHGASSVVHPEAYVSPTAGYGKGVFVGPHAVVHTGARLGDHCIINSAAVVEHHNIIGANAHIAPGVALGGVVRVGRDALLGVGSRVLPKVEVGDRCVVGAGSAVLHDVSDGERVVGVPARPLWGG